MKKPTQSNRDIGQPQHHARYATLDEVSGILGKSKSWLAKMRMSGDGPPYIKVGRSVLYELDQLHAWLHGQRRTSTSAPNEL